VVLSCDHRTESDQVAESIAELALRSNYVVGMEHARRVRLPDPTPSFATAQGSHPEPAPAVGKVSGGYGCDRLECNGDHLVK